MRSLLSFCVILVQGIDLSLSAGVITRGPSTQVVILNEFTDFQCNTAGSPPRWVINDTNLDSVRRQYQEERAIRISLHQQRGSSDYVSLLEVHAIQINNNTAIQCAVYSGDAESETALLIIQGLLVAPPALTVTALNLTAVHLTWSPPFTFNVTGNLQPSILAYNILIKNGSGDTILEANSTVDEYLYTVEKDDSYLFNNYFACVAGINGVGIGQYSQSIRLAVDYARLSGPNTSTVTQFSCVCFCHESLVVTWLINGSFLDHFHMSPQFNAVAKRDYTMQCPNYSTNVLEIESVSPFTVGCAAVYVHVCDRGNYVTSCRTRVYSSQTVFYSPPEVYLPTVIPNTSTSPVTVTEIPPASSTNNTTVTDNHIPTINISIMNEKSKIQPTGHGIELTIGIAAGITASFCALIILILSIVICREKNRRAVALLQPESISDTAPTTNDVIYDELCGDPGAPPTGAIYESIKQSQLMVDTQVCVAYDSTNPAMEPCVAYMSNKDI